MENTSTATVNPLASDAGLEFVSEDPFTKVLNQDSTLGAPLNATRDTDSNIAKSERSFRLSAQSLIDSEASFNTSFSDDQNSKPLAAGNQDNLLGTEADAALLAGNLTEPTMTITAEARGSQTPLTATLPDTLTNGDFLISADIVPTVGDGLDEVTTWTFDLTQDPNLVPFLNAESLSSAILTLELTPTTPGIDTDTPGIAGEGLPYILSPEVATLPLFQTSTVSINLLDTYSADQILAALETGKMGKIPMYYGDDALVSFARIELTSNIPVSPKGKRSSDFNGDKKDDLLIRSSEWAGLLTYNGIELQLDSIQNGWIGDWNLDTVDQHFIGDFNGDGLDDVFIRSPEWAGLLFYDGTAFQLNSLQHDWIGDWNLDAVDQHFVGDFNGDGKDDVFIRSPEWAGLLTYDGAGFQLDSLQFDRISDWRLDVVDQHFVGDFNGDNKDDVFIRNPEWAGLLTFSGTGFQLNSLQHDWIGDWNLDALDQHFVGDFDGDGKDDVFIRSLEWVGLLTYNGTSFHFNSLQFDRIGDWNLGVVDQHFVGDFNGDGKDDMFIRSPEWAGLLAFNDSQFQLSSIQHDWIDGWNLGFIDQHFVGDFDNDGKDDLFIRSPQWAGLLSFSGTQFQLDSIQYDWIGDWNLKRTDQHFVGRPTKDLRPKRLWADTTGVYGEYGVVPALNNVPATFEQASGSRNKRHDFYFGPNESSINGEKPDAYYFDPFTEKRDHIQSVARLSGVGNENLFALSRSARDAGDAALYVAQFNGIQSDGDAWKWAPSRTSDVATDYFYYRLPRVNHAGGIQALGSMVFVAADSDDGEYSDAYVQVMDLRNPWDSTGVYANQLIINGGREELDFTVLDEGDRVKPITSRAASVAAVRLESEHYLVFVRRGTEDKESGWFFISDSPDIKNTGWQLLDFWRGTDLPNGTPWEEWETINFVPEAGTGNIYMVAMGTSNNKSFLYRLTETVHPITGQLDLSFEYIKGRGLNNSGVFSLLDNPSTRYGAGIHVTPNRNIVSYISDAIPAVQINEFRYSDS